MQQFAFKLPFRVEFLVFKCCGVSGFPRQHQCAATPSKVENFVAARIVGQGMPQSPEHNVAGVLTIPHPLCRGLARVHPRTQEKYLFVGEDIGPRKRVGARKESGDEGLLLRSDSVVISDCHKFHSPTLIRWPSTCIRDVRAVVWVRAYRGSQQVARDSATNASTNAPSAMPNASSRCIPSAIRGSS